MSRLWILLLAAALAAAQPAAPQLPTVTVVVEESITGTDAQGGDVEELKRIAKLERDRIHRAREELPRLAPALARIARQDIGSAEAELTRVLVSSGETATLGRRTFLLAPTRIEVDDGAHVIVVDLATSEATVRSGDELRRWKVLAPAAPRPASEGKPGRLIRDRPTVAFPCAVENKPFTALVDLTLANPFAVLRLDGAEDDPFTAELARLPGFPLMVEQPGDRVVRRWTAVEIR